MGSIPRKTVQVM